MGSEKLPLLNRKGQPLVDTLSEDARQIRRVRGTPTSHYCVAQLIKLPNDTTFTTN